MPMPTGPRLVVEWADGQLTQPLPLPAGMTPCEWVARLGEVLGPDRRVAAWSVHPGNPAR
jgi:hypothetical protein